MPRLCGAGCGACAIDWWMAERRLRSAPDEIVETDDTCFLRRHRRGIKESAVFIEIGHRDRNRSPRVAVMLRAFPDLYKQS